MKYVVILTVIVAVVASVMYCSAGRTADEAKTSGELRNLIGERLKRIAAPTDKLTKYLREADRLERFRASCKKDHDLGGWAVAVKYWGDEVIARDRLTDEEYEARIAAHRLRLGAMAYRIEVADDLAQHREELRAVRAALADYQRLGPNFRDRTFELHSETRLQEFADTIERYRRSREDLPIEVIPPPPKPSPVKPPPPPEPPPPAPPPGPPTGN